MKSSDIHIRTISQKMPQPPINKYHLKITYLKFHSNFTGANELFTFIWVFHYLGRISDEVYLWNITNSMCGPSILWTVAFYAIWRNKNQQERFYNPCHDQPGNWILLPSTYCEIIFPIRLCHPVGHFRFTSGHHAQDSEVYLFFFHLTH